jgi:hypothetical protein
MFFSRISNLTRIRNALKKRWLSALRLQLPFVREELKNIYLHTDINRRNKRDGLAAALAASATKRRVQELLVLAEDELGGDSRVLFIKRIAAFGGDEGKQFVLRHLDDPALGEDATFRAQSRRWIGS